MATTIPDGQGSTATNLFYGELFADPLLKTFYGDSGYANLGFWDESTPDAAAAGDRLLDVLIDLVREREGAGEGGAAVLDVACGHGGTTRRLAHHFGPSAVTGIEVTEGQLGDARRRAPGCTFHRMSATDLQFPDGTFDLVCSVEAAFHFRTRRHFFNEARRVLKPGGFLGLTDLLMTPGTPLVPHENHLADLQSYATLLESCGFQNVIVRDVTKQTWWAFRRRLTGFLLENAARYMSPAGIRDLLALNIACAWAIRASVLAVGRRPR